MTWFVATLAVVLDTFLAIVYKVPSVTTVLDSCVSPRPTVNVY